jgi:hypothetical protein
MKAESIGLYRWYRRLIQYHSYPNHQASLRQSTIYHLHLQYNMHVNMSQSHHHTSRRATSTTPAPASAVVKHPSSSSSSSFRPSALLLTRPLTSICRSQRQSYNHSTNHSHTSRTSSKRPSYHNDNDTHHSSSSTGTGTGRPHTSPHTSSYTHTQSHSQSSHHPPPPAVTDVKHILNTYIPALTKSKNEFYQEIQSRQSMTSYKKTHGNHNTTATTAATTTPYHEQIDNEFHAQFHSRPSTAIPLHYVTQHALNHPLTQQHHPPLSIDSFNTTLSQDPYHYSNPVTQYVHSIKQRNRQHEIYMSSREHQRRLQLITNHLQKLKNEKFKLHQKQIKIEYKKYCDHIGKHSSSRRNSNHHNHNKQSIA